MEIGKRERVGRENWEKGVRQEIGRREWNTNIWKRLLDRKLGEREGTRKCCKGITD